MNKSLRSLLSLYAAMGLYSMPGMYEQAEHKKQISQLTEEEKRLFMNELEQAKRAMMLKKGLREFNIDGYVILALNDKNAKRKIENIKKRIKNQNHDKTK